MPVQTVDATPSGIKLFLKVVFMKQGMRFGAAGIRAAKVFAVVCQDVVREKISLSRDFHFDLPDGHPYTPKVLPS